MSTRTASARAGERDTGFENGETAPIDAGSKAYERSRSPDTRDEARRSADAWPLGPACGPADPVDLALARALSAAVDAGRLDLVATLAEELRARRLAAAGNVVVMPSVRPKAR